MEGSAAVCRKAGATWQQCWLVLDSQRASLDIHPSKEKCGSAERECVRLDETRVMAGQDDKLCFFVHCSSSSSHCDTLHIRVESVEERQKWLAALEPYTNCEKCNGHRDVEETGSDDEFHDANDQVAPISTANGVHTVVAQASDVEEDPDYVEREDIASSIYQNRSVIMHILSEARRGLDLTRMRLPAFILEKRSTLEMCSGFLSHPDLFAAIPDHATARERMVAIARFYCSSFHAQRTCDTAKKPYNPVLGETFHCFWDLPISTNSPNCNTAQSKSLMESGPVPYASYNSVTFRAEQVSHHPPVSAFYAECLPKRIYVTGSVQTKIRFLGLSVGVYNTASVKLHLLDHGEEYSMTVPNTYIRSLLTYPWMELGGCSTISCPQTGFTASFDFHCKPFYGGTRHRVSCEISHKSEKEPFHKIEGEWNGVMYTRLSRERQEVFMDTINTPTVRKQLLKLSAQDPGESRKRWQHVTEALARGDIDAASEAKHIVEEQQRAEVRERQEKGVEWTPQYFHLESDGWAYNNPLCTRLRQTDN